MKLRVGDSALTDVSFANKAVGRDSIDWFQSIRPRHRCGSIAVQVLLVLFWSSKGQRKRIRKLTIDENVSVSRNWRHSPMHELPRVDRPSFFLVNGRYEGRDEERGLFFPH